MSSPRHASRRRDDHAATTVRLVGGQELLVLPSLARDELAACLSAALPHASGGDPVALRDAATHVVYPLSLLLHAPRRFQDGVFAVVFDGDATELVEEAQATDDVPEAALLSPTSTKKHGKRRHLGRRHHHHHHNHHRSESVGRPEFVDAYDQLPKSGRLAMDTTDDEDRRDLQSDTLAQNGDGDDEVEEDDDDEDELLRELDLTDFELPQLVHVFIQACPRGRMDRTTFSQCLEKILSQSGRYDPLARKMFERLFAIFDPDNESVVDVAEFLGGVSVFASGERDDKIRVIFDLYDADHDGLISLYEMTKYLTAVFIVIAETSPELFQQKNVDPMELGAVTAQQCFHEANVTVQGRLSFDAFQKWYSKPGPTPLVNSATSPRAVTSPSAKSAPNDDSNDLSLANLRELTGLASLSAEELFDVFSTAAMATESDPTDASLGLTRDAFKKCFFSILQKQKRRPTRALVRFLDRLFNAFDRDGSDSVDFVELTSGLSILCGGSRDEKVVAAFSLFDADGDGFISRAEMQKYLASVYNVVFESHPETRTALGIDAAQLALFTTHHAFELADLNHDDKLSLEEFRKWYSVEGNGALLSQPTQATPAASVDPAAYTVVGHQALASIEQIAAITGLQNRSPAEVFELLASKVNGDGVLSRQAVHETFAALFHEATVNESARQQLHGFVDVVLDAFDPKRDGFVDFCELASGLSVCCDGTTDQKVKAAFTLFDVDHEGFISQEDMEMYVASVFRMLFTALTTNTRVSPEELAKVTAEQAFQVYDTDRDGRLSLGEFTNWYTSAAATGTANSATSHAQPTAMTLLPTSARETLKEMQQLTKLGSYDVNDILEFFEASSDAQGAVNKPTFFRCFTKLLSSADETKGPATDDRTRQLLLELFELFDTDDNGVIDVQELGAGLSILCGGNLTDKTKSLFTLYDVNHDGYIAPNEMKMYLTSVFKVLYKASPDLQVTTGGLTPSQLAEATTIECFQAFDKNGDNQLSFEEFEVWISQQKAHTGGDAVPPLSVHSNTDAEAVVISVDVAKKLTGLHALPLEKVADIFSSAANSRGQLTRDAFDRCFYKYVVSQQPQELSANESARVHEVIDRLFTAFDADQNGLVDLSDLSSGLSILCGGSRDDKVLAAFALYDTNGDGLISQDEMSHYLTSVFKLLFALDPSRQRKLGSISAEELATITASEIFDVADTDGDGKLNVDEFKKWYTQPQQEAFNAIVAPLDLEEVRKLTNLGNVDVVDVFERFAERADADGLLDRTNFDACFEEIIELASHLRSESEKLRAKVVADRLFDVFDRDHDGRIDFSELASGLSVLCKGARDAKVKAAFRLYDFNGDGFISLDEMTRYLASIFTVLYEVQPQMAQETGVSAAELGEITAEQAFLEADRNLDGKLSYDEFLTWYNSPSQAGLSSAVAKTAVVDSSLKWMPLNEVKTLTNLNEYEPEEVFEVFATEANGEGLLSREAFHKSFRSLMKTSAPSDPTASKKIQEIVDGLFSLFDSDGSGFVDFGELASGLSVLCGGTQQQKVRAAFALFDFNGDGVISLEEMTRYLTSVFKVLFQVSPPENMAALHGITPEELGQVTAQQAFQEADLDEDGKLTLEGFTRWYEQPGGIGEMAKDGEQLFSLAEARRLTNNLQAFSPVEVFEALAERADDQGLVSKQAFDDCFRAILSNGHPQAEYDRLSAILNRLFELFDIDKNGYVDFSEISSGLSVFCGGTSDDKVKAAFSLYDYNGDGFISMEEMARYLTAVFKVLQEASPRDETLAYETAEELGLRTAQQAFGEADRDQDERLSYEEFREWYTNSSTANMERLIEKNIPEWLSLQEVRRLTNLGAYTVGEVFETFAGFASNDGTLNKDAFRRALVELQRAAGSSAEHKPDEDDADAQDRLRLLVERIFSLFDADKNGVVDFNELASGLSILCGGTETDKARAAFNLYDVNQDGYISLGEMRLYLVSVFKVLYEVNPETKTRMGGVTAEELGEITAEQAFEEADIDKDGRLSFEEFRSWYLQPNQVGSSSHVPEWISLQVVKQMTHLEKYPPNEVFEVFATRCSEDGTLSREAFEDCFELLIDPEFKSDEAHLARVRLILDRLFTIFDTDGNGVVDFCELSSGLSVLCGGSREDKVRAAFALYDLNQDGYISLEEMVRYLTSVFKVLYETNRDTRAQLGVEPEELATITAEQCFAEADLNHDGRLSLDEFVRWYSRTSDGVEDGFVAVEAPVLAGVTRQLKSNGDSQDSGRIAISPPSTTHHHENEEMFPRLYTTSASSSGEPVPLSPRSSSNFSMNSTSMERARQLLKLDSYEVNDVFEIFAEAAPSGELNFSSFKKCFEQIIKLAGGHETAEEKQEAEQLIRRLFRVFDSDKSNTVDFGELASGLSVLSGSSIEDKVRAAFQLYDINGDGFISLEEMVSYMASIFKVMYETTDSTKTKMNVKPDELAKVTAAQCFKEADLNQDGKLSFDEFKKWCTAAV